MLERIKIQNFKGIKSCEVKDLRKINLFIGKNDSGKSTILEAAYYTLQEYYSAQLQNIMTRRTDVFTGGSELWFKYETKSPILLSTLFEGTRLDLVINWSEPNVFTRLAGIGKKDRKTGKREKWVLNGNGYSGRDFSFYPRTGKQNSPFANR